MKAPKQHVHTNDLLCSHTTHEPKTTVSGVTLHATNSASQRKSHKIDLGVSKPQRNPKPPQKPARDQLTTASKNATPRQTPSATGNPQLQRKTEAKSCLPASKPRLPAKNHHNFPAPARSRATVRTTTVLSATNFLEVPPRAAPNGSK